jgi:hypothetical protein
VSETLEHVKARLREDVRRAVAADECSVSGGYISPKDGDVAALLADHERLTHEVERLRADLKEVHDGVERAARAALLG